VSGAVPVAVTENVAVCPTVIVCPIGWVVIEGDTGTTFTVSVARALVTAPVALFTITRNVEPLSDAVVAGVV
jgi:hypothetical protein